MCFYGNRILKKAQVNGVKERSELNQQDANRALINAMKTERPLLCECIYVSAYLLYAYVYDYEGTHFVCLSPSLSASVCSECIYGCVCVCKTLHA